MPKTENSAQRALDEAESEDRRQGAKDRRKANKDRRDLERLADEIAPRRHPDVRSRRSRDR